MTTTRIHKGDEVQFLLGTREMQGRIREDRGPIGVKGRHLYLVEFQLEPQAETISAIELPADQFEIVARR